jgi:hypothetical protein
MGLTLKILVRFYLGQGKGRLMRHTVVILICIILGGCAGSPAATHWAADRHTSGMLKLEVDMSTDEVINVMGKPEKTEMYRGKEGEHILVYMYITEGKDSISRRWSEANYTPVIFVNDKLDGWGWNYLNDTSKRYEFVIKSLY